MSLDLVHSRSDSSSSNEFVDLKKIITSVPERRVEINGRTHRLGGEVGDTDGSDLGLGERNHRLPGVDDRNDRVDGNLVVVLRVSREELGGVFRSRNESDGPVLSAERREYLIRECGGRTTNDEVEVEVINSKLSESVVEGGFDC